MATDEIIWRPDPEAAARTRMGRFMAAHGLATLADLQRRSMADPEGFWDAVWRDLAFHWSRPYRRALDTWKGIEWPRWFEGGRLNLADNSVDRHIAAGRGDKLAVIAEAEDGTVRTLSYRELAAEVGRLANALKRLGIRPGDTVGILLPMCAEAVIATLAVVRIGAAYTPGTTGRPKGTVLTHGGFSIKNAHDFAYLFDLGESDRLFWVTDLGWLMGPMLIGGALLTGGTAVLFEGTPDYPKPDRLWSVLERHRVTVLGISPTAVRALMPHGAEWVTRHDLSSLKLMASTGEPWNPEPYRWLFETAGKGRLPIINYTGGTEISGGILSCVPIAPIKPCSFAGPIPGMAADVYDDDGRPVRGQVGELVVTRPWPGMTAGFWKDRERYLETYWSRWPDVWVHGDWAYIDPDGSWFIQR